MRSATPAQASGRSERPFGAAERGGRLLLPARVASRASGLRSARPAAVPSLIARISRRRSRGQGRLSGRPRQRRYAAFGRLNDRPATSFTNSLQKRELVRLSGAVKIMRIADVPADDASLSLTADRPRRLAIQGIFRGDTLFRSSETGGGGSPGSAVAPGLRGHGAARALKVSASGSGRLQRAR